MGSGKDRVQRKRKPHGAWEKASRAVATTKKATKLAATKAAAAKQDVADQRKAAIGKKGSTIQQLLAGSLSSAQLLSGQQVHAIAGSFLLSTLFGVAGWWSCSSSK